MLSCFVQARLDCFDTCFAILPASFTAAACLPDHIITCAPHALPSRCCLSSLGAYRKSKVASLAIMVSQVCLASRNCSGHGTRHWYSAAQLPESEYCGKIFRCARVTATYPSAQVACGLACEKFLVNPSCIFLRPGCIFYICVAKTYFVVLSSLQIFVNKRVVVHLEQAEFTLFSRGLLENSLLRALGAGSTGRLCCWSCLSRWG